MKQISPLSKGSGKLGSTVFAVNSGVQIAREYQPKVTNPNTEAQQDTRARFKLMSQLSAVMAPVIAIKKDGLKSARNQFQSENFDIVNYEDGEASINLNLVQLTKSNRAFAGFIADRTSGTKIAVQLLTNQAATIDRVVYILYKKNEDQSLELLDSRVADEAGNDGKFPIELPYTDSAVVIYGYGVKDTNESITAKFGNMVAPNAEKVAKLLVASSENMNAVNLTKTAGLTLLVGQEGGSTDQTEYQIDIIQSGGGTLTGAGRYQAGEVAIIDGQAQPNYHFQSLSFNEVVIEGATLPYHHVVTESGIFTVVWQ